MRNFKINFKYIKHLFYQYRRVFYLLTLVFGFLYPLVLFISRPNYFFDITDLGERFKDTLPIYMIPNISVGALFVVSFIAVYLLFSYTNNKSTMDNYLSLPISKENLFFNQFIFSFLLVFIPFAIMWIGGWVAGRVLYADLYQALWQNAQVTYSLWNMLGQLLWIALFLPVLQGIALFALVNTPSLIDGVLYGISLHLLPWFIYLVSLFLGNRYIWGFSTHRLENGIIGNLRFNKLFFEIVETTATFTEKIILPNIIWIVVGFLLVVVNQKLFAKRSVESIGSTKVNNWFYPVLMNFGTYLLIVTLMELFVFSSLDHNLRDYLFPLLLGFIFYFVLDMIRNRGLSHILKMTLTYAILYALSFSTFFLMDVKGGELLTGQVDASKVQQVEFYTHSGLAFTELYTKPYPRLKSLGYRSNFYTSTDPETIKLFVDMQNRSKDLYYRFFGNRWGNENDVLHYLNIIKDDSGYQYHKQENPFQLDKVIRNYYRVDYFFSEDYPTERFDIIYTDANNREKVYEFMIPLEWMDNLLNTLTTKK